MKSFIIGFLHKSLFLFFFVGLYGHKVQAASRDLPLISLPLESDASIAVRAFFEACLRNETVKAQEIFHTNENKQVVLNGEQFKVTYFLINNLGSW